MEVDELKNDIKKLVDTINITQKNEIDLDFRPDKSL